jgi:hypothetical protein
MGFDQNFDTNFGGNFCGNFNVNFNFFFYFVLTADPQVNASSSLGVPQSIKSFPDEITQILRHPSSSLWLSTGFLIVFLLVILASTLPCASLKVPGWFGGTLSSGPGDLNPPFKCLGQGKQQKVS